MTRIFGLIAIWVALSLHHGFVIPEFPWYVNDMFSAVFLAFGVMNICAGMRKEK